MMRAPSAGSTPWYGSTRASWWTTAVSDGPPHDVHPPRHAQPAPPPAAHALHHALDRALHLPGVRRADAALGARRHHGPRGVERPHLGASQSGLHLLAARRVRAEGAAPAGGGRGEPLLVVRRHLRRAEEPLPELRRGSRDGRRGVA